MYNNLFNDNVLVIYDGRSPDGTCSAWAFRYAMYLLKSTKQIKYHPVYYDKKQNMPNVDNCTVIMLGFTYNKEIMQQIVAKSFCTIIFDNHEKTRDFLETVIVQKDNPVNNTFSSEKLHGKLDIVKNSCQVVWDVFIGGVYPWFMEYMVDYNSEQFETITQIRDVLTIIKTVFDLEDIDTYDILFSKYKRRTDLIQPFSVEIVSNTCKLYEQRIVSHLKETAILGTFECFKVFLVNCPQMFVDEVGKQLADDDTCDFALLYSCFPPNEETKEDAYTQIYLRGCSHRKIDLSKIAAKFGGGGHETASSFCWNGELKGVLQMV